MTPGREQQPALEPQRGLVVQQLLPPAADDVLRDVDGDDAARVGLLDLGGVVDDRPDQLAVRRVEHLERDVDVALVPLLQQPAGLVAGWSRRRRPRGRWAGWPWRTRAPAASACAAWRPGRSRAPGSASPCPRRRPRAPPRRCRSGARMPRMTRKKKTIARIAIQAPARNLVTSTMTSTTAVKREPDRVDHPRALHPAPLGRVLSRSARCRVQCRIMPSWLRLNETKTPTM